MNKKDMLNSIRNSTKKAEVVDNALKHLGGTAMDYLAFDFDGSRMLGAFSQFNNNYQFVGDLDAVLSNNGGNEQLKTKRDLIVEIFRNLIMLSFTENETERSGIITTLSGLYELETKYNDWGLIFEQVHTTLMPEIFFQELHVRFRRELKKFGVWITFVEGNSTAYTLELEASLETHEIITIKPITTGNLYYLGTGNLVEYEPTDDYNPATKKYVDDKINTIASKINEHIQNHPSGNVLGNRFTGKIANFLGDSQTDSAGNYKTKPYYEWLKDILGLSKVNVYGVSGTTIMPVSGQTKSFCDRYVNMDSNADLIVVWGGVNDHHYQQVLGTIDDTTTSSFYGSLDVLCKGLIEKYPTSDIVFITPCIRSGSDDLPNQYGKLKDYAKAIVEVCEKYNIYVYDAFKKAGMPINTTQGRTIYTVDGLHLNDVGHEKLGKSLSAFSLYSEVGGIIKTSEVVSVESITLNKTTLNLAVGGTETLSYSILPDEATNKNVQWSSSNTSIATVDNGIVTGVRDGQVTITVTTVDGNKKSECSLTVGTGISSNPVTGITIDKTEMSITVGEESTIIANVIPSDADNKTILWSNNGSDVANVNNGVVTGLKPGSCVITATTQEGNFSKTCNVTVEELNEITPPSVVGKTVTFTGAGSYPSDVTNITLLIRNNDTLSFNNGDTLTANIKYSNATKTILTSTTGMQCFQDNTGLLNNGSYKTPAVSNYLKNTTVTDNTISGTALMGNHDKTYDYIKIPIPIKVNEYPVSFRVDECTLKIGSKYVEIVDVGGFYAEEGFSAV